jgi:hypothetical protein
MEKQSSDIKISTATSHHKQTLIRDSRENSDWVTGPSPHQ